MTASIRLLGQGYEPHVDEDDEGLHYSLPVDSQIITVGFSFPIRADDLEVLRIDPYRRAALGTIAHTVLQRSLLRGQPRTTPADFDDIVASVLHSSPGELEEFIDRIDRDHHIVTRIYIAQAMARWGTAG